MIQPHQEFCMMLLVLRFNCYYSNSSDDIVFTLSPPGTSLSTPLASCSPGIWRRKQQWEFSHSFSDTSALPLFIFFSLEHELQDGEICWSKQSCWCNFTQLNWSQMKNSSKFHLVPHVQSSEFTSVQTKNYTHSYHIHNTLCPALIKWPTPSGSDLGMFVTFREEYLDFPAAVETTAGLFPLVFFFFFWFTETSVLKAENMTKLSCLFSF